MKTKEEWLNALDDLIVRRGGGARFEKDHHELSVEASKVDFVFLTMILSGEFEQAKRWVEKATTIESKAD